jgi:hypothetical protein
MERNHENLEAPNRGELPPKKDPQATIKALGRTAIKGATKK